MRIKVPDVFGIYFRLNEFTTMKTVIKKVVKRILTWYDIFLQIWLIFEIIIWYITQF